jgi:hypothetical protein
MFESGTSELQKGQECSEPGILTKIWPRTEVIGRDEGKFLESDSKEGDAQKHSAAIFVPFCLKSANWLQTSTSSSPTSS